MRPFEILLLASLAAVTAAGGAPETSVDHHYPHPTKHHNATAYPTGAASPTKGPHRNSTATTPPANKVNGGALPQQMQHSMAGLIGFCIVGLIML